MKSSTLKEIMIALPCTEEEDKWIKTLSSETYPTQRDLQELQLKHFEFFRGRKAIEHRYLELLRKNELNDQLSYETSLLSVSFLIQK